MRKKIFAFFNQGHTRSVEAKRQIVMSFGIKGVSILINLAYVPLLIDYLGKEEYGIWLTLTSIVTWFTFFDIGLGNGLRNSFSHAIAKGNHKLARTYVSTTYAILSIIFGIVLVLLYIIAPFINWALVFNTSTVSSGALLNVSLIVFSFFFIRFVVQLIGVILLADQKPAINNSFNVLSNIICIAIIYILKQTTEGSLPVLGLVLSGVPVFVLAIASILFYSNRYRQYAPSLNYVDFKESRTLLSLGVKFFILQISGIVMYSATNLLITQFSAPGDVAVYNVSYKMFSIFTMVYGIILTPMWSATTEAFALNDFKWIRNVINKMQKLGIVLVFFILIALFLSNKIYYLWVGERIIVPFNVSLLVAISSIMYVMTGVFVSFQNGIGKIKLTLYWVILQTLFYLPISYVISVYFNFGFIGILIASIICELPVKYIQIAQYFKIINSKAVGIWNQ